MNKLIKPAFCADILNRQSQNRQDKELINLYLNYKTTKFFLFSNSKPFLKKNNEEYQVIFFNHEELDLHEFSNISPIYAGQEGENQVFLINIKDEKKEEICKKYNGEFVNLRSILWTTDIEYLEILGLGSSLFGWHKHNQFCANCGNATKIKDMGFSRVCNSCQTEHFPRIDPVAIMLVLKEDKCLFGRSVGFLPNLYSILAGFIEPCETIEQACRREIYEETKIKIGDVKIIGNQPWPFVSQLMIGLEAYALNDEIEINENEIEDAIWLDKEQAKQLLSKNGLMIDGIKKFGPRKHTIANSLVQYWLNQ